MNARPIPSATRIPFYYALADAFTICDQHFCSSLTGTTPNRLHLWTGTIRAKQSADSPANVRNEDVDYGRWASWPTFPERLEDHGISWKIYQNELTLESGLTTEEDAWLANFGDNPIEWFTQYRVRFAASYRRFIDKRIDDLPGEIDAARKAAGRRPSGPGCEVEKATGRPHRQAETLRSRPSDIHGSDFEKLSGAREATARAGLLLNTGDPDYRSLTEISYRDGGQERKVAVPKGDVLHQFREDVADGKLPTVSWLVAPERFSDHPSSAWYGAWYIAEVLNILTKNPAVWKKTVFILTYDENDGYFDHVPPFVAPHPRQPKTGRVSQGIDAGLEYVELAADIKQSNPAEARGGPIGLGYRVPMVIASPWSRGGASAHRCSTTRPCCSSWKSC